MPAKHNVIDAMCVLKLYIASVDRAMLCTGTPGIGKTMLLPYLLHHLAAKGASVVLSSTDVVEKFLFSR